MTTREYWFARRFPLGDPRRSFSPVHWKGWLMSLIWIAALVVGGASFAWLFSRGEMMQGVIAFTLITFVTTCWYLLLVRANGDQVNTVHDYRKGKLRV